MASNRNRDNFEGERLRRKALGELSRALVTGRLIAFVGSWVTSEMHYPNWKDFLHKSAQNLLKISNISNVGSFPAVAAAIKSAKFNNAVYYSIIEEAALYHYNGSFKFDKGFRDSLVEAFSLTKCRPDVRSMPHVIISELGIDRVITLNYDLEFEWEIMTSLSEKMNAFSGVADQDRRSIFKDLLRKDIVTDPETNALSRILPGGKSALSDTFARDATDRLIEFAVGSPDYDSHIMHLHGRVIEPSKMIVSLRDYQRQYRKSGVTKLPFEHALRILFAGNPVLFLGIGMNESEVTDTLEQFISDHPERRTAQAFILWNAPLTGNRVRADANKKSVIRLSLYHKFGILVIFDDEIIDAEAFSARLNPNDEKSLFKESVFNLARYQKMRVMPFAWNLKMFRSMQPRVESSFNAIDIWGCLGVDAIGKRHRFLSGTIVDRAFFRTVLKSGPLIKAILGPPGSGKGALAAGIRQAFVESNPVIGPGLTKIVTINAGFVNELDSIFGLLSGVYDNRTAQLEGVSRKYSLSSYLYSTFGHISKNDSLPLSRNIVIIINGMDRFLATDGSPLSIELDDLIRTALSAGSSRSRHASAFRLWRDSVSADSQGDSINPFNVIMLGSPRVLRYLERISDDGDYVCVNMEDIPGNVPLPSGTSVYLEDVARGFKLTFGPESPIGGAQQALMDLKRNGDSLDRRRAFFSAYLTPESLSVAGVQDPELALEILTSMAFIGQPIEDVILAHIPKIRTRVNAPTGRRGLKWESIKRALSDLEKLHLVIGMKPFEGQPAGWRRYGLHRVVIAELRDRFGIPLSDSRLSCGFNISLFAAQPVDDYIPEADVHLILGEMVDCLVGAYKEPAAIKINDPIFDSLIAGRPGIIRIFEPGTSWARSQPHVVACLRASLSLLRSYYSTAALLMRDSVVLADETVSGPLTEHAERLGRLIRAAEETAESRKTLFSEFTGSDTDKEAIRTFIGPEPFYPDDIVWLHNELGVIRLTQGDLYEARRALNQAHTLNECFVEHHDKLQNWRRIQLNQLHLDIERGKLARAESRILEIKASVNELARSFSDNPYESRGTPFDDIVQVYRSDNDIEISDFIRKFPSEIILSVALVCGYSGLCDHLRGHLSTARRNFTNSLHILRDIGEQRGYAIFQRHYASLCFAMRDPMEGQKALRLCVAAAGSIRQNDVDHHARVELADRSSIVKDDDSLPYPQMHASLLYAAKADMYRLRIEVRKCLARLKLEAGDYDVALEHAADAMAIAARYGFNLRKVSLRILIGTILVCRGDARAGLALINRAAKNADRIGYQRAVEVAEEARIRYTIVRP